MKIVYLDNNATTMPAKEVVEAMLPYYTERWGNPSSMHTFGGSLIKDIEGAREKIAALIGAKRTSEIVITSGGTESDNAAIMGTLLANPEKRHIITTKVEHAAVRNLCHSLEKRGYRLTEIDVDSEGMLDVDGLKKAITPDTAIVSVMWANNETGVISPIEEVAEICKEKGVVFHTDAVQAVGKVEIDVEKVPVDMLSASGHKLHGPKGIGFLYIRRGTKFHPFIIGGHHEMGRRGGTENVPGIIGLGKACELARNEMEKEKIFVKELRDRLEEGIIKSIPKTRINGNREKRLPNTTNISFENIEGEAILLMLNEFGICASSGSACTSGSLEPSHVLKAMNVPFSMAHGSIRFSLSRYNTQDEIDLVLEKMPAIINRLREISPFK
jgi:cysteine desulfurase